MSEEIIIPAAWVETLRKAPSIDSALSIISELAKSPSWSLWFSFNSLIDNGHSIVVVEHNLDLIKCSDNIIDLGPDGGENGGDLIFNGKPNNIITEKKSRLKKYLELKF